MTRAEERRAKARRKMQAEQRALDEARALEAFIPTPRPTLIARAVQRVLGAPPVDDPVHGRRQVILERVREGLGLEQTTAAPSAHDGETEPGHRPA
jgi:hypothetical protein